MISSLFSSKTRKAYNINNMVNAISVCEKNANTQDCYMTYYVIND